MCVRFFYILNLLGPQYSKHKKLETFKRYHITYLDLNSRPGYVFIIPN